MTKREMFNAIREAVIENKEMVAFIDHEIELLNKKSVSRKPTKTQVENETFKADIVAYLAVTDRARTIREMQSDVVSLSTLSNQKITHLLIALIKEGKVVRTEIKRVAYYALAQ